MIQAISAKEKQEWGGEGQCQQCLSERCTAGWPQEHHISKRLKESMLDVLIKNLVKTEVMDMLTGLMDSACSICTG